MRLIRNFIKGTGEATAANLSRQLSQFEDNVSDETDAIRSEFIPAIAPQAFDVRASGTVLRAGQSAGFDTSAGDVAVLLAKPKAYDAGKFVAIWKIFAANNVVVQAASDTFINRGSSSSFAAVGLGLIYCDGVEYWS